MLCLLRGAGAVSAPLRVADPVTMPLRVADAVTVPLRVADDVTVIYFRHSVPCTIQIHPKYTLMTGERERTHLLLALVI